MVSWMYIDLHVKYLLFLPYFNETWIFSIDFWKLTKHQISEKSDWREPVCSMRMDFRIDRQTDRQTDVTKLMVTFRVFANAPRNNFEDFTEVFWLTRKTVLVPTK